MFDTIYFKCPTCGAKIELQSKGADSPSLSEYDYRAVPLQVAAGVLGSQVCCNDCCETFRVHVPYGYSTICLGLESDIIPELPF